MLILKVEYDIIKYIKEKVVFFMFSNIGNKIKTLAQVVCWLGICISILVGFVLMVQDEETAGIGVLIMVFGSLLSWIGSFITYGFGQLVENSDILVSQNKNSVYDTSKNFTQTPNQNPINNSPDNNASSHQWRCNTCGKMISENSCHVCDKELINKISTLDKWKKDGLITEEEYQQKMENLKNE